MTTTKNNNASSRHQYSSELVRHFLIGTPKPQLPPGCPPIKDHVADCVLTDEQLLDLSILLKLLHEFDNECQGPPDSVNDTYFFCRDEVEEALVCFLAPFCREEASPIFLPEYSRHLREFNDDLNNYLLALRLCLGLYVPKLFQRYECLVLGFTIKLARMRVLTSYTDIYFPGWNCCV